MPDPRRQDNPDLDREPRLPYWKPDPAAGPNEQEGALAALQRLLNRPGRSHIDPATDMPTVEPPPMFRPEPLAVGQELGQRVHRLMQFAPQLRGRVSRVQEVPTHALITDMIADDYDPTEADESNILGGFADKDRDIWVNPSKRGPGISTPDQTLAHEFSHAAGYTHDSGVPYFAGDTYQRQDVNLPNESRRRGPVAFAEEVADAMSKLPRTKVLIDRSGR